MSDKAKFECRYCEGRFASLDAYDAHLLGKTHQPINHPVCTGERDGAPVIDPAWVAQKARMRSLLDAKTAKQGKGGVL